MMFFFLANGAGLADPGLEYDELLFVNGALGAPYAYHDFIYREALGVPTMLMPYIGALKAWVWEPVFAVFGVSVNSIRVPAVLLAAVGLILAVLLIYRIVGKWPAVALALMLATDPAYGALARTDWGPIVLSALLRMTALYCYFAFIRTRSVRYLWLVVVALSLGLFNKLDFVWFIVAFCAAAILVHRRELFDTLRRRRAAVLAPIMALVGVGVAAFPTLILPAEELPTGTPHLSIGARISEVAQLFQGTFDGATVYENMTASRLSHPTLIGSLFPYVLACCVAVALWSVALGRSRPAGDALREVARGTTFFLVMFVVLAGGIVVTRQATGPWHVMLLWPLPAIMAVCLLSMAARLSSDGARRAALVVVISALGALLVTQIRTTATYVQAYRSDRQWSGPWSTEIYAAARTISHAAPRVKSIITADWGIGTELFALGDKAVRMRFADEWASFTSTSATTSALEREWFQGRRVIVIYHAQAAQVMRNTTQRVQMILAGLGSHVRPIYIGRQIEADEVVP